jgi:hypothetical protein
MRGKAAPTIRRKGALHKAVTSGASPQRRRLPRQLVGDGEFSSSWYMEAATGLRLMPMLHEPFGRG